MSSTEITTEEANILFHDTVEHLLADGCSIVAHPLLLADPDDEVFPALLERIKTASDEQLDAWHEGDVDAVSKWLAIPVESIDEHQPISELLIFVEAQQRRGIDDDDASDERVAALLQAWLDSFADGHLFDPKRPHFQIAAAPDNRSGSASEASNIPRADLARLLQKPPTNAWLLVGDSKSFFTKEDLSELRNDPEARTIWTAPRQIQPGDLVFIYFLAPRKAVHFVARAASYPAFDPRITVNAESPVDPHQWWVELADVEPVPAVSFSDLADLMDGHLILRGKPSHYLPPRVVAGLSALVGSDHQLPTPIGSPELPDPDTMTFEQWRSFSTGPLSLATQIEQYVVEPLLRLALAAHAMATTERAMKLPVGGVPDYVVKDGGHVTGAVEVKIGVQTPADRDWKKSPEVHQILRYMRYLDAPGILIDANRVFFLDRGGDQPTRAVERKGMTSADLKALAQHLTGR